MKEPLDAACALCVTVVAIVMFIALPGVGQVRSINIQKAAHNTALHSESFLVVDCQTPGPAGSRRYEGREGAGLPHPGFVLEVALVNDGLAGLPGVQAGTA